MNPRIFLILSILILLFCVVASISFSFMPQINLQNATPSVFSLTKYPSEYPGCANVYVLSSDQDIYVRDVTEFALEPLISTFFLQKIGEADDLEIFLIPENDNYAIVRSKFGFKPEIYRKKSAPPIKLSTLDTLEVKKVIFSDFDEFEAKRLWSTSEAALIEDIFQALDQRWEKLPEAWEPHTYRVDLLSDQIKGLSYYILVEADPDGQMYFYTYEHPGRGVVIGDLLSRFIQTRGRNR